MRIIPRLALAAALLAPGVARAQFSLSATQVDGDGAEIGPTYDAACSSEACRTTIPMQTSNDVCVLNIEVTAPGAGNSGAILFAVGPCRSGARLAASGNPAPSRYSVDQLGAASVTTGLRLQPAGAGQFGGGQGADDALLRPSVAVRLDILAARPR